MKIDKKILQFARKAACRELFIKYNGRSFTQIEREMRELGFADFSRRIFYPRNTGRGKCPGWIAEFGITDWTASDPLANSGSSAVTAPGSEDREMQDSTHAGGTGVGKRDAFGPVSPVSSVPEDFIDFQAWLKRVSPGMTWDWRHQVYLYEKLQRITDGKNKRLMIFMPPRHGKSEMVTVRYSAWRMRRKPEMKIIIASYAQELANTFSRKIKGVICDDLALDQVEELQEVAEPQSAEPPRPPVRNSFKPGAVRNAVTPQTAASVFPFSMQRPINTAAQWGTTVGGGLRAVGVGGGVTGFGADLIIIDDPVKNRAQAESETYRERVWQWYNDDLYTRLEPNAQIILIQTRWHEDDLAGRLIKQMNEGGEQWEIVDLPALAEDLETGSEGDKETGREGDTEMGSLGDGETGCEGDAMAVSAKPRTIGFPRLYSHVNDAPNRVASDPVANARPSGVNDWTASDSLATSGSSAVTAPGSERGGEMGSEGVEERGILGDGVVDWTASDSLANSGSSAVTAPGIGDREIDHSTCDLPTAPEVPANAFEPKLHHAGGTGVGEQDAHPPVAPSLSPLLPKNDPLFRLPGDALCPERYDRPELEMIRSQLGMYGFSALYQQKPTPADGAIFKREWLRNIVEAAPPGLRWYRGYDLAISTRTTADYTASFRVAIDDLGFMYIADGFRERIEYPEQRRFIIERMRSEPGTLHGIEDSANCKSIIQDLRRDSRLLNYAFRAVPVVGDKLTRALKWSPIAEEGKLRLVRGAWIKPFIHELLRFPLGKHDDQTDAVSIAVHMMAGTVDSKLHRF